MTGTDVWTILRLLEWTTRYLREHGSDSPRLDAEVLLAHCRGSTRIELYTAFEQPASEELRQEFRELVRQRARGVPVAYLVGSREFFSRRFQVNREVLIPRPETEFLITALLDKVGQGPARKREWVLADVGTGSGVLAITAALELPAAQVHATDTSLPALEVARANAQLHQVQSRIHFHHGDLLEGVPSGLNFVLSNPPYVRESEFVTLDVTVRDYEPRRALVAGERGTEVIEQLIPRAAERLIPGGWFLCEVSPLISADAISLIGDHDSFERPEVVHDFAQHPRVLAARRKE